MEVDSISRDALIKYNLQSYLPYVCECVDGTHLLIHLDYYSGEQRREISQLLRTSPVGATRKAFEVLMEKDLPGIFTALLQSLQDEYPKIVKLLQGDVVKCDENYRRIVTLFTPTVIGQIHPTELLGYLRKFGVLTEKEAEEVRAEERIFGQTQAAFYIVTNIHRHMEDWFKYFLMSLIETDCGSLAEQLDKDMVEKIKSQKEFKAGNKDTCEDENVQEVIHEVSISWNIETDPKRDSEADITMQLKCNSLECHCDKCEQESGMNIATNHQKDTNNTKQQQEDDDVTALKQVFRQEAVDDTYGESRDITKDLDDAVLVANGLDKSVSETGGDISALNIATEKGTGDTMDLTFAEERTDLDIEMAFNIPTDVDKIDAEDNDIPLREYQKELAKEGSEGENVIVLAPTNTGKTRVACSIMQVHLRRQRRSGKIGKVVFLVENEALAFQQATVCSVLLPAYRTKAISGSVQRYKKQLLKDFIDRRDILVVTAQVLLNALQRREISCLTTFSMIVIDECHHTGNLHSFNQIMSKYMDLKLRAKLDATALPQVIGITASLGVGGKIDASAVMKHLKGILANLDAKYLCTVRKNKEQLDLYENNLKEEIIVAKRRQEDISREAILHIMDDIDKYMRNHQSMTEVKDKGQLLKIISQMSSSRGTEQFLQWRSAFKDAIASVRSDAARRMLNPCRLHLEVYNTALLIHADARIKDAEAIIEEFMNYEMEIDQQVETDKMLISHYRDLKSRDFSDEPENPKLLKMQKHLMNDLGNNQDAQCIIFVKSRELARALINWMHEVESLKTLNAGEFVGQVASSAQGGMTKFEQKDVLEYFKNGHHKVIVATSVAEEGLDITKCNLVIRYEYVTNEIIRLQARGRARANNSKYYILTSEGSWIVEKEERNAMLEKLMNYIVPTLQAYTDEHSNELEEELWKIQEQQKLLGEMKQEQRIANKSDDEIES